MSIWEWLGFGLLLGLVVAVLVAFFLYLRTAYRRGGGRDVKTSDLQTMKDAVNRMAR
jgi:predicted RND superfamily exporter protein